MKLIKSSANVLRLLKILTLWIFGLVIACIFITQIIVRFVLWPQVESHKEQISQYLSQQLQVSVQIGALKTHWDTYRPSFEIEDLVFEKPSAENGLSERVLVVPKAQGTIRWNSLWTAAPRFYFLRAQDIELTAARNASGVWSYAGLSSPASSNKAFLLWILNERNLNTENLHISVKDAFEGEDSSEFTVAHFSLHNEKNSHQIELQTFVTPTEGRINFSGAFNHQVLSDASNWRNWQGRFTWDLQKANLANFLKVIKFPVKSGTGVIDFHGQATIDLGLFKESALFLNADQVDIDWINTRTKLQLHHVNLEFDQTSEGRLQTFVGKQFVWQLTNNQPLISHSLNDLKVVLTSTPSHQDFEALKVSTPLLPIKDLAELIKSLPIPDHALDTINRLSPEGEIEDLQLEWINSHQFNPVGLGREAKKSFHISGSLKELGWQSFGNNTPGVEGLSGHLSATEEKGTFLITSNNLKLTSETLFSREKMNLSGISGALKWEKKSKQWLIETDQLQMKNPDLELKADIKYLTPDEKLRDHLDLSLSLVRADAIQFLSLIPKTVAQGTIPFLRDTVSGGLIENTQFDIHGDTRHIPYSKTNPGEFNLELHVKDGRYRPLPTQPKIKGEWPIIENIEAHLTLKNNKLKVDIPTGNYLGVKLKDFNINLDLAQKTHHLFISGTANGPSDDLLRYLTLSPVASQFQAELKNISLKGNGIFDLKLDKNLEDKEHTNLLAKITLNNNQIRLGENPPGTISIGSLSFDEKGLKAADITGNFLGGPISLKTNATQANTIDLNGVVDANQLMNLVMLKQNINEQFFKNIFSGKLGLNGSIQRKNTSSVINLNLDLRASNINLPEPLVKKANDPLLGRVHLETGTLENAPFFDWQLKIGDVLQTNGLYKNHDVERISVALGNSTLPTNTSGAHIGIDVETLDLDDWLQLADDLNAGQPNSATTNRLTTISDLPITFTAKMKRLKVLNRQFEQINISGHSNNQSIEGTVSSTTNQGNFSWIKPNQKFPAGSLKLNFSQFNLPQAQSIGTLPHHSLKQLQHLPNMDIAVENFNLGDSKLGSVILSATAGDENWVLNTLSIKNKDSIISSSGRWELPKGNQLGKSFIDFDLSTQNASDLIARLSTKENIMSGGEGHIKGQLNWQGSPLDFNTASLNGDLSLDLKNGAILQVDAGASKLLSILSLQSLFKFATLNFKGSLGEAVSAGTPFDKITATANIKRGNLRSNDFELISSVAKINARGIINLSHETQDLRVTTYPRLNFGSASLAAFYFVNPIVGFTALVGQYLFSSGVNKALQSDLLIQGNWQNPEVIPLDQSGQPLDPEIIKMIRRKALLNEPAKK